jgi:O-acetyl-ADP-ribose deacetylase (regulator of RNase III)
MINVLKGDLLNATEDIIAHQVNCQGVMGSGVAKAIKHKYPIAFNEYSKMSTFYKNIKHQLLGKCQIIAVGNGKYVANLFGQYNFGWSIKHTDYEALKEALTTLKVSAKDNSKSVALPYNIGCGLGGGNWGIVLSIIDDVFNDYDVSLYNIE